MAAQNLTLEQFINYLRYERHFSPYTARCYGADLRQYAEFLNGDAPGQQATPGPEYGHDQTGENTNGRLDQRLKNADAMVIRGFLTHLDGFGYSPATTARKIATLRSFYKWMLKRGDCQINPMLLIRTIY